MEAVRNSWEILNAILGHILSESSSFINLIKRIYDFWIVSVILTVFVTQNGVQNGQQHLQSPPWTSTQAQERLDLILVGPEIRNIVK